METKTYIDAPAATDVTAQTKTNIVTMRAIDHSKLLSALAMGDTARTCELLGVPCGNTSDREWVDMYTAALESAVFHRASF